MMEVWDLFVRTKKRFVRKTKASGRCSLDAKQSELGLVIPQREVPLVPCVVPLVPCAVPLVPGVVPLVPCAVPLVPGVVMQQWCVATR